MMMDSDPPVKRFKQTLLLFASTKTEGKVTFATSLRFMTMRVTVLMC